VKSFLRRVGLGVVGWGNHEMPHDGYTNFMKDMG
jgi:hypothetical protein